MLPVLAAGVMLLGCGDDPGQGNNNANQNNQQPSICGDGEREGAEECDNGSANSDTAPNACRASCLLPACGDGVVDDGADYGEECDDGNRVDGDGCQADCRLPVCGDGVLDPGEVCDDSNSVSGDGCRDDCLSDETCGNAVLDLHTGEECDAGLENSDSVPDACRTSCQLAGCGDAVVDTGEACDDGNRVDADGCAASCLSDETCGNSVLDTAVGEECDLGAGNSDAPNVMGCRTHCQIPGCGDGIIDDQHAEACDDGDNQDGDGCAGNCAEEPFFSCQGTPSVCSCVDYHSGPQCLDCTVFVDAAGNPLTGNGTSWAMAYTSVQDGIDTAVALNQGCDVWIAGGTYPTFVDSTANTVTLASGIALYGGFGGWETDRADRDWTVHISALDGSDGATQRVHHVMTAQSVLDATLDGLTFTGGDAGGSVGPEQRGGGLYATDSSLFITNCTFVDNSADHRGAGVAAETSTLTVTDSTFIQNSGEGLYASESTVDLTRCVALQNTGSGADLFDTSVAAVNCRFEDNVAEDGGGVLIDGMNSEGTITDCRFIQNTAVADGGGVRLGGTVSITSSYFGGNEAGDRGGGIWGSGGTDNTFVGNTASTGGGVYGGGAQDGWFEGNVGSGAGIYLIGFSVVVSDCTFVGNQGTALYSDASSPLIRRSHFLNNQDGSAIYFAPGSSMFHRNARVENCVFRHNHGTYGGAMSFNAHYYDSLVINHSTFVGNSAFYSGAVYWWFILSPQGTPTFSNNIFWENPNEYGPPIDSSNATKPVVTYSIVQGGYSGAGNVDDDPDFVNAPLGWDVTTGDGAVDWIEVADGTLYGVGDVVEILDDGVARTVTTSDATTVTFAPALSEPTGTDVVVGNWGPGATDLTEDLHLKASSPCIDAGTGYFSTPADIESTARFDHPGVDDAMSCSLPCLSYVDMGAYEYTQ